MRTVLFYRDFRRFHGGHLKVWDYFNHVLAAPGFTPRIWFSPKTNWDASNPWSNARDYVVDDPASVHPDIFFVAGRDWLELDRHPDASADVPVLNLVQGIRHADPESSRYEFLGRRAIRICVSDVVADAVRATGEAPEPLITIRNGLDLEALPSVDGAERDIDVLVAALKKPELGAELASRLNGPGRRTELLDTLVPRSEFLDRLRRAKVTVFMPLETEGFFLPPLEGMALGTLVVCPEHRGGATYAPGENCLFPSYTVEGIAGAVEEALGFDPDAAERMRANAWRTAEGHDLAQERAAFHQVLDDIDRLWS